MIIKLIKRDNSDEDRKFVVKTISNVISYCLYDRDFGNDELEVTTDKGTESYINMNYDEFFVMNDNGKTIDRSKIKKYIGIAKTL